MTTTSEGSALSPFGRQDTLLLITGAAGSVARYLIPDLARAWTLRLQDRRDSESLETAAQAGHEIMLGDLTDPQVARRSVEGVHAIIHLAGNGDPCATPSELVAPNLAAWSALLEAAAEGRLTRIVFASSVHAGGADFHPEKPVDPTLAAHPCCPYGASKVHGEALGRAFSRSTGIAVAALRLGSVTPRPRHERGKFHWLHPADLVAITENTLRTATRFGVHHAVSRTATPHWSIATAQSALGYEPAELEAPSDHVVARPLPHGPSTSAQPAFPPRSIGSVTSPAPAGSPA